MNKKQGKRAQGALEFLMTYGWAFLVIIIMIGALAYFGVLDPQKFLPERCQFGNNIACAGDSYRVTNGNIADALSPNNETIVIDLVNNFGTSVIITNLTATTDYSPTIKCGVTAVGDAAASIGGNPVGATAGQTATWKDGERVQFKINCTNAELLQPKDKAKFQININWYAINSGAGYIKSSQGELLGTVQD